jgi:hypothetical protein
MQFIISQLYESCVYDTGIHRSTRALFLQSTRNKVSRRCRRPSNNVITRIKVLPLLASSKAARRNPETDFKRCGGRCAGVLGTGPNKAHDPHTTQTTSNTSNPSTLQQQQHNNNSNTMSGKATGGKHMCVCVRERHSVVCIRIENTGGLTDTTHNYCTLQ